jgi:hypothetical protein
MVVPLFGCAARVQRHSREQLIATYAIRAARPNPGAQRCEGLDHQHSAIQKRPNRKRARISRTLHWWPFNYNSPTPHFAVEHVGLNQHGRGPRLRIGSDAVRDRQIRLRCELASRRDLSFLPLVVPDSSGRGFRIRSLTWSVDRSGASPVLVQTNTRGDKPNEGSCGRHD